MTTLRKPRQIDFHDGYASCESEQYDDHGGGAFGVDVAGFCYSAKEVRKLITWLEKAEKWIANKELYRPKGRKRRP